MGRGQAGLTGLFCADAAARAQFAAQLAAETPANNVCDAKNAALYKAANRILDAYSKKDAVFSDLANHEPFVRFSRVPLENIVQSDRDKL